MTTLTKPECKKPNVAWSHGKKTLYIEPSSPSTRTPVEPLYAPFIVRGYMLVPRVQDKGDSTSHGL